MLQCNILSATISDFQSHSRYLLLTWNCTQKETWNQKKLNITVAHRLDTIEDFDRVVVFDDGCVVEAGNPRELMMAGKNRFRELWGANRRPGRVE